MPSTICPRVFVETVGGVTVASFADAELITEEVIGQVGDQLEALIAGLFQPQVLLNFRDVRLMSSTMLAVLLRVARRVASGDGRLKLCSISPDLMVAFRITRFDRLLEIHEEEWSALDSF